MSLPEGFVLPEALPLAKASDALALRIVSTKHASSEPAFRAAGTYRFDDPAETFGTLYCAPHFSTCFLETLIRSRSTFGLPRYLLDDRSVLLLLLDLQHLQLVDMVSTQALARMRLDLGTVASEDYRATQRLAQLVHVHESQPDGIVYRSRFDPDGYAIVLFDRAASLVRAYPGTRPEPLSGVRELAGSARNKVPFWFA